MRADANDAARRCLDMISQRSKVRKEEVGSKRKQEVKMRLNIADDTLFGFLVYSELSSCTHTADSDAGSVCQRSSDEFHESVYLLTKQSWLIKCFITAAAD